MRPRRRTCGGGTASCRARGSTNDAIFALVGEELRARRFRVPELSARQLRRMVYG